MPKRKPLKFAIGFFIGNMVKKERRKKICSILNYLAKQQVIAFELQDIHLFDWYSNGLDQLICLGSGRSFQYLAAVPKRFFRK